MRLKTLDDPVALVRAHPEMYLPYGRATGPELVMAVAADALLHSEGEVVTRRLDGWWVVASEFDWVGPRDGTATGDYFTTMAPDPEAGPNSMRAGVLLGAIARDVVTTGEEPGTIRIVQGQLESPQALRDYIARHPNWTRFIAFRLDEGMHRTHGPA